MPQHPVDLDNIKDRLPEALVESIFRRAKFQMTRFGPESDLRGMMKAGEKRSCFQALDLSAFDPGKFLIAAKAA